MLNGKELNEKILEYRKHNPDAKLISFIREELKENFEPRSPEYNKISWRWYEVGKKLGDEIEENIDDLNNKVIDHKNYFVEGDNIIFYKKEGDTERKFEINIELIKKIWYDYSRHGADLTMEEILQKYGLKPEVFNLIKSRLRLYKASNAYPGFLLDEMGDDEQDVIVEQVVEGAIKDKFKNKYVKSYDRKIENEYKKAIGKLYVLEDFVDMLNEKLTNYSPEYIAQVDTFHFNNVEKLEDKKLYVAITDLHIGKKNTTEVIKRLEQFTEDMIEKKEKDLTIFCLGDLAEILIEGGRHPGQIESMDGPFGFDLIMLVVDTLQKMIMKIYASGKRVKFIGIAGNHGVLSKDKGGDVNGTGELIIYEMIKRGLQDYKNINMEYHNKPWVGITEEDFHFIINHGAGNHTTKKASDILWEHGSKDKHNIILQGDKHHTELQDTSKNASRVLVPAFAGKNIYDERLGISSYTGYISINKTRYGTPATTIIRFDSN